MIKPEELKQQLGVDGLCLKAEEYFQSVADPLPLMAKPFHSLDYTPHALYTLGLLLSGLKLSRSMRVMDFGAGTCWLTRILSQLQCRAVALDPSPTALEFGKRLLQEQPIVGPLKWEPEYLPSDGRVIDLPDESLDRIVCFESFHHVANREQTLSEFSRVLKQGGIVGFSEPGKGHWKSRESQHEMENYQVLEEDVLPHRLFEKAREYGFDGFRLKLFTNPEADISLDEYKSLLKKSKIIPLWGLKWLWRSVMAPMSRESVFFFHKGDYVLDSRSEHGLDCLLQANTTHIKARVNEPVELNISAKNTGRAKWLCSNEVDVGIVRMGGHLYNEHNELLDWDFVRMDLDRDVGPDEEAVCPMEISFPSPGRYIFVLDLVSENIRWFAQDGAVPLSLEVSIS